MPAKKQVTTQIPRLRAKYQEEATKTLQEKFQYKSSMAWPRLEKIVLNMGVGDAVQNKQLVEDAVTELTVIAAQKAVKTYAQKSVSNFKLREGMPIGAKVTLRGAAMYAFLDKVITVAAPRVRDFRGFSPNSFDGRGNYSFGVKEQIVFPEINYDKIARIRGLEATIVTTAASDDEAFTLLHALGFPFASHKRK